MRVPAGVGDDLRLPLHGHVPDDARPQRELEALDRLAHGAAGDPADELVPLEQPDGPRLGVQRFDDSLEHPWQELVDVERRVEVERGLEKEAEAVVSGDAYG